MHIYQILTFFSAAQTLELWSKYSKIQKNGPRSRARHFKQTRSYPVPEHKQKKRKWAIEQDFLENIILWLSVFKKYAIYLCGHFLMQIQRIPAIGLI